MNISNFLKDAIESNDHDNLALLWIDITKTNIKCVDCEKFHFYKFDNCGVANKKESLRSILPEEGVITSSEIFICLCGVRRVIDSVGCNSTLWVSYNCHL